MADKKAYEEIQKKFPEMNMDHIMKRIKAGMRVTKKKKKAKKKKK